MFWSGVPLRWDGLVAIYNVAFLALAEAGRLAAPAAASDSNATAAAAGAETAMEAPPPNLLEPSTSSVSSMALPEEKAGETEPRPV